MANTQKDVMVKPQKLFIITFNVEAANYMESQGIEIVTMLYENDHPVYIFKNKEMPLTQFRLISKFRDVAFTDKMYFAFNGRKTSESEIEWKKLKNTK